MDYLKLILDWFSSLGVTKINEDKLKRQLSIITQWFKSGAKGVVEAVTGFGKTMVAIITIYRLNLKHPEANIIVVVPSIKLKGDWEDNVEQYRLKNVTVYVVNSYVQEYIRTQQRWKCVLMVCDEVHNYLSDNALMFNQTIRCTDFNMFLGLSATLNDSEKETLENIGIPIIDTVSLSEARRFSYISDYVVYNYGIELQGEELEKYGRLNDIHNSNYAKFRHFQDGNRNWELARACGVGNEQFAKVGQEWRTGRDWRQWYSTVMEWNGEDDHIWSPKNISITFLSSL